MEKTARDYISEIKLNRANVEHILQYGNINGSLLVDLERIMDNYANQKVIELKKRLAEARNLGLNTDEDGYYRIFDLPDEPKFKYNTYKVVGSGHTLVLGFTFLGKKHTVAGIEDDRYVVEDPKYPICDGYAYSAECEIVKPPMDYKEYFDSIQDPDSLRSDYKKRYYELKEKYRQP